MGPAVARLFRGEAFLPRRTRRGPTSLTSDKRRQRSSKSPPLKRRATAIAVDKSFPGLSFFVFLDDHWSSNRRIELSKIRNGRATSRWREPAAPACHGVDASSRSNCSPPCVNDESPTPSSLTFRLRSQCRSNNFFTVSNTMGSRCVGSRSVCARVMVSNPA